MREAAVRGLGHSRHEEILNRSPTSSSSSGQSPPCRRGPRGRPCCPRPPSRAPPRSWCRSGAGPATAAPSRTPRTADPSDSCLSSRKFSPARTSDLSSSRPRLLRRPSPGPAAARRAASPGEDNYIEMCLNKNLSSSRLKLNRGGDTLTPHLTRGRRGQRRRCGVGAVLQARPDNCGWLKSFIQQQRL